VEKILTLPKATHRGTGPIRIGIRVGRRAVVLRKGQAVSAGGVCTPSRDPLAALEVGPKFTRPICVGHKTLSRAPYYQELCKMSTMSSRRVAFGLWSISKTAQRRGRRLRALQCSIQKALKRSGAPHTHRTPDFASTWLRCYTRNLRVDTPFPVLLGRECLVQLGGKEASFF